METASKTKKDEVKKVDSQSSHKGVYEALAAFQEECPPFVKNIEGFGYTYTGLPEILKTITPILRKHGLMLIQGNITSETTIGVRTILRHIETGEELSSKFVTPMVELKGMNLYQSAGSAITYARRYDLSTLLGIISEKDDDGGTGKPTVKVYGKKPPVSGATGAPAKKRLEKDTETYKKVVGWLKDGGKLEHVTKKFVMSDELKDELLGIVNEASKEKGGK